MSQAKTMTVADQRSVAETRPAPAPEIVNPFSGIEAFEAAQRMAKLLSASTMVPNEYRDNPANCVVAMEFAYRTRSSVFAVMQHAVVIHGKPGWTSTYMIALINQSGKFETDLDFEYDGAGESMRCRAFAQDRISGKWRYGTWVSIQLAKLEGWYGRSGSKWKTMPEQMLAYRAAAFFGRMHASDVIYGMQSDDELRDTYSPGHEPVIVGDDPASVLRDKLKHTTAQTSAPPIDVAAVPHVVGELVDPGSPPGEKHTPVPEEPTSEGEAEAVSNAQTHQPKERTAVLDPADPALTGIMTPAVMKVIDEKATTDEFSTPGTTPPDFGFHTMNDILALISKAESKDALDEAMDLSRHLSKASERKRLKSMYDARLDQLGEL